jgi:CheY-like chemotaxis protein
MRERSEMSAAPKILLLDDEPDFLEYYREILGTMKCHPDVVTSDSGPRAIALLESEHFNLFITDLKMPKMDGLQVLSIVRRKFPLLRVVILSGLPDEQIRSRAYAMGVDLFWEKPSTALEIKLFKECVESLLESEPQGGFRGIQSKSLLDLIQLECLSQNSCVLRITNGSFVGRIWIQSGDLIDAAAGNLVGEAAFREIFGWKAGNFEVLPAEPERVRRINTSYQGLLLDSAQALDEARGESGEPDAGAAPGAAASGDTTTFLPRLARFGKFEGVDFVVESNTETGELVGAWGIENPDALSAWLGRVYTNFTRLGEAFQGGELKDVEGFGLQRHLAARSSGGKTLCVGFRRSLSQGEVRESMKRIIVAWAS